MKKMGYLGDGPLGKVIGIIEPLIAQFKSNRSKTRVGYDEQDKKQTSSKARCKHNDSSSSTLVWVPQKKDGYSLTITDIITVNLSLLGSYPMKEPSINTPNNEDDDDSTKS